MMEVRQNKANEPAHRIGVCSWSFGLSLDRVADAMRDMDVQCLNLALQPFIAGDRHGFVETPEAQNRAIDRIRAGEWDVTATMISFPHEDYTSPETIAKTGGVIPDERWPIVLATVTGAARLTGSFSVPYLIMHAGHPNWNDAIASEKFVSRINQLRDVCCSEGVQLLLETGQETADDFRRLMLLVDGIGINFDPANMIDVDKGDPCEAVRELLPWIRHVHIKDAIRPAVSGSWGKEVPWGDGEVDALRFLSVLENEGYSGSFAIERESGDDRLGDIRRAIRSVRDWSSRSRMN